jgi:hypothetical protein
VATAVEPAPPARPPSRVRRAVTGALADPVERTAYALVAVSLAVWAWAASQSYFRQDDFVYYYRAASRPLSWDGLFADYQGHLQPGQFLLVEGLAAVAPLSWLAAVAVVLLLRAVACVAAVRLLVELFGRRPGILAPLALFLFSPLLVLPFLWWAAALQVLTLQAALVLAALAHVRWLRTGRPLPAGLALLAVAGGLFCWEKALLIPVVLVGVELLARRGGLPVAAARRVPVWAAHVLLAGGYLVLYLARTGSTGRDATRASVGDLLELAREALLSGFGPGLVGGPWRSGYFGSLPPEPSVGAVVVAAVVVAGVVVATALARPRMAGPAWLALAAYLAFDVALVAALRLDFIGPALGRDPRYTADAVPVAALVLGFALFPPAGSADRPAPARRWVTALAARRPTPGPLPVSLVALIAYLASCLITTAQAADHMHRTSGRDYVTTARAQLAAAPGVSVWDGAVPDDVLSPLFGADATASRVFGELADPPRFDEPTADLRILDGLGLLRGVDMITEARSRPSADPDCGYGVQAGQQRAIPLDTATSGRKQAVRVGYYNGRAVPGTVTVDGVATRVTFQQGLHYVYVVAPGPVRSVQLSIDAAEAGAGFCATDVVVGQPWPKPGS